MVKVIGALCRFERVTRDTCRWKLAKRVGESVEMSGVVPRVHGGYKDAQAGLSMDENRRRMEE